MEMLQNTTPQSTGLVGRDRRKNDRYAGPFDGFRVDVIETPLSIFDLSRGGCFINSIHEQTAGVRFQMKIDLPRVGWVRLTAETLYARIGYGFAVQFVDVDDRTAARLDQGLEQLIDRIV